MMCWCRHDDSLDAAVSVSMNDANAFQCYVYNECAVLSACVVRSVVGLLLAVYNSLLCLVVFFAVMCLLLEALLLFNVTWG